MGCEAGDLVYIPGPWVGRDRTWKVCGTKDEPVVQCLPSMYKAFLKDKIQISQLVSDSPCPHQALQSTDNTFTLQASKLKHRDIALSLAPPRNILL